MKPGDLVTLASIPSDLRSELNAYARRALRLEALNGPDARLVVPGSGSPPITVPVGLIEALSDELFPTKGEATRAVLYLDQCILSELVKWRQKRLSGKGEAAAAALAGAIDQAVLRDETAICVESYFHREESSALAGSTHGTEFFSEIWQFLAFRSRGLHMLIGDEVLRNQALQRVSLEEGAVVLPASKLWRLALSRDPEQSNARTGMDGGAIVAGVHWSVVPAPPGYAAQLERERASGQHGTFADELREAVAMMRNDALSENVLFPWFKRWGPRGSGAPSHDGVMRLIESPAFTRLPYVDCKSALVASLLSEPVRLFRDSDHNDIQFSSLVLPYVHLMMVDANLANRLRVLKLGERYRTKVLGAKLDDYYEAAEWLASRTGGPLGSA